MNSCGDFSLIERFTRCSTLSFEINVIMVIKKEQTKEKLFRGMQQIILNMNNIRITGIGIHTSTNTENK